MNWQQIVSPCGAVESGMETVEREKWASMGWRERLAGMPQKRDAAFFLTVKHWGAYGHGWNAADRKLKGGTR